MQVTIHGMGRSTCSLTGHEVDGITATIPGVAEAQHFGWEAFQSIVRLLLEQGRKAKNGNGKPKP